MSGSVLDLFAKLTLDSSEYDRDLEGARGKLASFSKGFGAIAKVGAAAFAAVGTATVAVGKQAFDAYANYQQLAGGIEKLFGKENAGIVAQYAEQAFLTSGKSVNEYYNSVSQITASLKRSIGDDMNEVARVADVAMRVISDNVNTFGSDAEFVENAIMGLSRNNYTMIDNLKLGYAGTAEGMKQLINDSGILGYELQDTSELATVGFDKMILAIEEVQKQQGIAGTTAEEALFTIEGAANATRSAWQNVITAIGQGEGLSEALSGLTTAIFGDDREGSGLLEQVMPRIQTIMESIGDFVVETAPLIAEKIPEIIESILPSIFDAVSSLTASLGMFIFQKLPDIVSTLYQVLLNLVDSVSTFILDNLPTIIESGVEMLHGLAQGIRDNLPDFIATIVEVITKFLETLYDNAPEILAAGVDIIIALVQGIIASVPKIISGAGRIISAAISAFNKTDWLSLGKNIISGIVNGLKTFGSQIGDTLLSLAKSAWKAVKSFFGISSPSKLMRDSIGKFIPLGMAEGIESEADSVYDEMDKLNKGTLDAFGEIPTPEGGTFGSINYGGMTFNIYGAEGQDVMEIAEAVKDILVSEGERDRKVYA